MWGFIKAHWIAYVIGLVVALAVGFGASYVFYVWGSSDIDHSTEFEETTTGSEEMGSADINSLG